jgi:hypothetical protein
MSQAKPTSREHARRAAAGALIGLWAWPALSEGFTPPLVALGELLMVPTGASTTNQHPALRRSG